MLKTEKQDNSNNENIITKKQIQHGKHDLKSDHRTLKSFPKLANSGIVESSFSYASTVVVGAFGGAPSPVGFLPGAFFSASG